MIDVSPVLNQTVACVSVLRVQWVCLCDLLLILLSGCGSFAV